MGIIDWSIFFQKWQNIIPQIPNSTNWEWFWKTWRYCQIWSDLALCSFLKPILKFFTYDPPNWSLGPFMLKCIMKNVTNFADVGIFDTFSTISNSSNLLLTNLIHCNSSKSNIDRVDSPKIPRLMCSNHSFEKSWQKFWSCGSCTVLLDPTTPLDHTTAKPHHPLDFPSVASTDKF